MSKQLDGDTRTVSRWSKVVEIAGDPVRLVHYLARLMKDERVPHTAKLKVAGAGLYTWVEGDILSDTISFVPGLGYVDDIILVVHGIKCLIAETEPRVAAELWPGDEASFKRVMVAVAWLDNHLYEQVRGWVSKAVTTIVGEAPAGQRVKDF